MELSLKEEILRLRLTGMSYNQISKELLCSKSTISYHLSEDQRIKNKIRTKKYREKNILSKRISSFINDKRTKTNRIRTNSTDSFRYKVLDFQRIGEGNIKMTNPTYTFKSSDIIDKFGLKTNCYLSGRVVNLEDPSSFEFDHIIPKYLGGDNSLENLGITTKDANRAKGNMSVTEFLTLCKDVLENNGYTVSKIDK